jgi:membrane-bound ClpP family serine protease
MQGYYLLALGLVLLIAEFRMTSFGALGVGGVAVTVLGALCVVDGRLPWPLTVAIAAAVCVALLLAIPRAIRALVTRGVR